MDAYVYSHTGTGFTLTHDSNWQMFCLCIYVHTVTDHTLAQALPLTVMHPFRHLAVYFLFMLILSNLPYKYIRGESVEAIAGVGPRYPCVQLWAPTASHSALGKLGPVWLEIIQA